MLPTKARNVDISCVPAYISVLNASKVQRFIRDSVPGRDKSSTPSISTVILSAVAYVCEDEALIAVCSTQCPVLDSASDSYSSHPEMLWTVSSQRLVSSYRQGARETNEISRYVLNCVTVRWAVKKFPEWWHCIVMAGHTATLTREHAHTHTHARARAHAHAHAQTKKSADSAPITMFASVYTPMNLSPHSPSRQSASILAPRPACPILATCINC
jgi:hypothetical protein